MANTVVVVQQMDTGAPSPARYVKRYETDVVVGRLCCHVVAARLFVLKVSARWLGWTSI